ncbi:hypothetical protein [Streptomyces sp. PU-14G]|uniref:hypothetical protein n=1 Tax=Streptomyces sp. PU-14G TaxID=2800808 RepID=UPI0034E01127
MQLNRPAATLAAAAVASALLLSGCGGGEGGSSKDGKIEGAGSSKDDTSPSPSGGDDSAKDKPADFRTSDIELPDDVELVFDWKQPSDPAKAAALDGAADYMRALIHGTAKQDPDDPVVVRHVVPLQTAGEYAAVLIKAHVKDDVTVTGKDRYYREKVGDVVDGRLAEVSFCVDQSDFFAKEIKSGKVLRTEEGPADYMRYTLVMQKPEKSSSPWRARTFEYEDKAVKQCKD